MKIHAQTFPEKYVYDDEISTYNQFVIDTKYFYSDEILKKLMNFTKMILNFSIVWDLTTQYK